MPISAVLFDAGNILYTRPRRSDAYANFFISRGAPGLDMGASEIKRLKLDSHEGKISEDEYYEELIRRGGITDNADIEHGKDIFREAMLDFEFTEGVADTLHRLKSDGLKLGVVTNTYNTTEEKLSWFRRIGIDKVWDSFATSCELKVVKPDPRIYLAALKPFDGEPRDALFVAHAQLELDGAKALNMSTVSFNRDDDTVTGDYHIDRFMDLPALVASLRTVTPAK